MSSLDYRSYYYVECLPCGVVPAHLHLHGDSRPLNFCSGTGDKLLRMDSSERVDNNILWHPSLKLNYGQRCAPFPGGILFAGTKPIQTVYLKDHLYVGGLYHGSERDKCRLFEYSPLLNTWDVVDIHLAEFALASYKSKLVLLGGTEYDFHCNSVCSPTSKGPTSKVWLLNDQYQLQEADIPPMNKQRTFALAVGHEEHLIVVGGDKGDSESTTIEIYDGQTKKWLYAPALPKTSRVQSIVMHPDGNLYVQLAHQMSSIILWTTLKSLSDSCTSDFQESDASSFWKEISCSSDRVVSNLMLCQGYLFLIGGSHDSGDLRQLYVYRPSDDSDPTQSSSWINIADVSVDLHKYTVSMTRIVSISDDRFLLLGQSGDWMEVMFLIYFHVAAFDLDSSFMQRDLGKLEEGANLCVYSELQPITFKLKERIGLRNLSEIENYVYRDSHDSTDSLHTIITRWIESSQPNIKPTWTDLIQFLEEFGEKKMFTSKLKHYLTSAPRDVSTKEINFEEETTKKLESVKLKIEHLCGLDLVRDADVSIQRQLQECVKLCDSAEKRLTDEYQELETKHKELAKEKEDLNKQLELLSTN